jgi:DNA-3-methyladenine glycosylase II
MARTSSVSDPFTTARRRLARRDPILKKLITHVGPCTLRHDPDGFSVLVRSIVSQQISTRAARAIGGRLKEALAPSGISPHTLLAASEGILRGAGLSAGKVRSLRDLAEKVTSGAVPLADFPGMENEDVIARLIPVRGIGRWTAEMFLIFSLGRLDILPVADYGLRAAVKRVYELEDLPDKAALMELAEPWRPYRSVATWYFWRSLGFVPQSDGEPEA